MADVNEEQVTRALRVLQDEGLVGYVGGRVSDFFHDGMTEDEEADALRQLQAADRDGSAQARDIVRRAIMAALDA